MHTWGRENARGGQSTLPRSFLGTTPFSALGATQALVCQSPNSMVISGASFFSFFLEPKGSSSSASPNICTNACFVCCAGDIVT